MAQAPGYRKLMDWTHAPIMPTPGAVGQIMQTIARQLDINVVGVDIGGATTDMFSVFSEVFNRTVSANLGMSYSISNVLAKLVRTAFYAGSHSISKRLIYATNQNQILGQRPFHSCWKSSRLNRPLHEKAPRHCATPRVSRRP